MLTTEQKQQIATLRHQKKKWREIEEITGVKWNTAARAFYRYESKRQGQ